MAFRPSQRVYFMLSQLGRLGGALWLTATGASRRARRKLYRGQNGLRILTLHDTPSHDFNHFRRLVDWVRANFEVVGPEEPAKLAAGQANAYDRDRVLFSFDDGFQSNYAAAQYLTEHNIRAIFFVVPSFLGCTMDEYLEFHREQSVNGFRFLSAGSKRGLNRTEIREMIAMGHLIAAHNYAHRDLGELTSPQELEYEIDRAIETVAEVTGRACEDFAIGFGRPRHMSRESGAHLLDRCKRVYSCSRGLNIPGISPRILLRDNTELSDPLLFHQLCMRGAADVHWAPEVDELRRMSGTLPMSARESTLTRPT